MKKLIISRLFLYRYRFFIGYAVLALVFAALLFLMPLTSPGGLSQVEMESAVASNDLHFSSLINGDVMNLTFRVLQKVSIGVFGLSLYSVKLPAILMGLATGVFLILLLNRWFSTNVALIASGFVVMSSMFLANTGMGTPTIMMIFWPVVIIWAGAKLVGAKKNNMWLLFGFFASLALGCYNPLLIYMVVAIGVVSLFQPHLRFFLRSYTRAQLIAAFALFGVLILPLIFGAIINTDTLREVFVGTSGVGFFENIETAFAPFFAFGATYAGGYLAPLLGMTTVALMLIGVVASSNKLYTAKNVITAALLVFAVVISGLHPPVAMTIFVPILLLVASGLELTINKWYVLFPENPYARLFGVVPIALFSTIALTSGLMHFYCGYMYTPALASDYNNDISLVRKHLDAGAVLLVKEDGIEMEFYRILGEQEMFSVLGSMPDRAPETVASLGRWEEEVDMPLTQIITSQKSSQSDRLYVYKKAEITEE